MNCKKHKQPYLELWPGLIECEGCFLEGVSERYVIKGQCPSGKNSVTITRTGHRFPNKRFSDWKKGVLIEIEKQKTGKEIYQTPVSVQIKYWASDRRRRDITGIEDALWHILERTGIVSDDRYLGGDEKICMFKNMGMDKENPRVEIYILK